MNSQIDRYTKLELSYIVPVFFNQGNTEMLNDLLRTYSTYSNEILERIQFIFVDDCSPIPIRIPEQFNLNILLLRVIDDIKWNQGGARNLGVMQARTSKVLLTDVDHIFPEVLFRKMLSAKISDKLYKFKRIDDKGNRVASACNIYFSSKSVFFKSLGYDEEFCGNYGYEDTMFFEFQKKLGTKQPYFNRIDRIIVKKLDNVSNYHTLKRDTETNKILFQKKLEHIKSKSPFLSHSRLFLNFKWEITEERFMQKF